MDVAFDPRTQAPLRARRVTSPAPARRPSHLRLVPESHPLLAQRDQELIRRIYPWLTRLVDYYYRSDVEGTEHLSDRACVMVSTHNGGLNIPDAYCLAVAFWRRFGLETPGYGLLHRAGFRVPLMGSLLPRLGAVPASRENAAIVLGHDHPLLVCPGGDVDALKPFAQRHRICFDGRMGFVAVAIRNQVPIIPIVSVGAHETLMILNDGRWLARVSGAGRAFQIKSIPLSLSFPFGLGIAGIGALPLPAKITVQVLPKIELAEPPAAADDPAAVQRCFDHVVATMQAALDGLAARRRRVFFG